MVKSCYVHIPFCKDICSYCDFCKMYYLPKYVSLYLEALEKEIRDNYKDEILDTIYIGGGTPSSLSLLELEKLFNILNKLKRSNNVEFTIECNFDSITKEKIDLFKKYGVNRISFGLETTSKRILSKLNRVVDLNQVKEIISYCRKCEFNNINIDLMYAIVDESFEELKNDLEFVCSLDIEHISTYSLIIEENTKFYIDKVVPMNEDIDYEMYLMISNYLSEFGFNHYEISNFSKNGYESRHNLTYWHNEEYYGFGLGAASYINNIRAENTRSIQKYLKGEWSFNKEKLSLNEKMEYELILGLRLKEGISKNNFRIKYNKNVNEVFYIDELVSKGYLIETKDNIYIPDVNWYLSNEILVSLLSEGEV